MKRYDVDMRDEIVEFDDGPYYLASEVDARIADLERELDVRKAAIEAQFRLMERVRELEKALHGILSYFRSGNGIPVERATIKADSPEIRRASSLL